MIVEVVYWDVEDTAAGTAAFVVFAAVEEIGIASDIFLLRAQYPIFERDLVTV